MLLCEAGRPDEAREHIERLAADNFAGLPRNHLYLYHLAVLAIACHALDDQPRAARLYDLLLPYGDHDVLVARLPWARWVRRRTTSACWPRPSAAGTTRSSISGTP